jgi:hypothetical protein
MGPDPSWTRSIKKTPMQSLWEKIMMSTQTTNKAAEKANPKTGVAKTAMDQEQAINQLRQEIRNLSKTVKEMQRRPNVQMVDVGIPRDLFLKVNAYLLDYEKETGKEMSLSEMICDAFDVYLWGEEENKRIEEERKKAIL